MSEKPSDRKEWRNRRNDICMTLCSAKMRAKGHVCSCYNGDEKPDEVHFTSCRDLLAIVDEALSKAGVPVPANV